MTVLAAVGSNEKSYPPQNGEMLVWLLHDAEQVLSGKFDVGRGFDFFSAKLFTMTGSPLSPSIQTA